MPLPNNYEPRSGDLLQWDTLVPLREYYMLLNNNDCFLSQWNSIRVQDGGKEHISLTDQPQWSLISRSK